MSLYLIYIELNTLAHIHTYTVNSIQAFIDKYPLDALVLQLLTILFDLFMITARTVNKRKKKNIEITVHTLTYTNENVL